MPVNIPPRLTPSVLWYMEHKHKSPNAVLLHIIRVGRFPRERATWLTLDQFDDIRDRERMDRFPIDAQQGVTDPDNATLVR